jgi:hypothetical protein
MARNGRSNIHDDAYMTDAYRQRGPSGTNIVKLSTYFLNDCASVTFDRRRRVMSVCVGLDRPTLRLFDRETLDLLAALPLPPRPTGGDPFTEFSGGGYFYLDNRYRAVIPTNDHHLYVVATQGTTNDASFVIERDYDLTSAMTSDDKIISALPDWSGRIWFATVAGVVGRLDRTSGLVQTTSLDEQITNSFAVDETGGVYIVSDRALYRFDASSSGAPQQSWREVYDNSLIHKPGQVDDGSGTTPTLIGPDLVAITDNADPMNVVVYQRAKSFAGSREVCKQPVFGAGASATDNSLIAAGRSIIVENNYGYEGPGSTSNGLTTTPGVARVDLDADGSGCSLVWYSNETSPTVVPKLSLSSGLIYIYTKEADPVYQRDSWYLTALDFHTGATRWKQLAGNGLFYNNNYAPITIAPDGRLYVGTLGGLVQLRDQP